MGRQHFDAAPRLALTVSGRGTRAFGRPGRPKAKTPGADQHWAGVQPMFTRSSQSASLKLRVHTSNEKASFRRTGIDAGGAVQQPSTMKIMPRTKRLKQDQSGSARPQRRSIPAAFDVDRPHVHAACGDQFLKCIIQTRPITWSGWGRRVRFRLGSEIGI